MRLPKLKGPIPFHTPSSPQVVVKDHKGIPSTTTSLVCSILKFRYILILVTTWTRIIQKIDGWPFQQLQLPVWCIPGEGQFHQWSNTVLQMTPIGHEVGPIHLPSQYAQHKQKSKMPNSFTNFSMIHLGVIPPHHQCHSRMPCSSISTGNWSTRFFKASTAVHWRTTLVIGLGFPSTGTRCPWSVISTRNTPQWMGHYHPIQLFSPLNFRDTVNPGDIIFICSAGLKHKVSSWEGCMAIMPFVGQHLFPWENSACPHTFWPLYICTEWIGKTSIFPLHLPQNCVHYTQFNEVFIHCALL